MVWVIVLPDSFIFLIGFYLFVICALLFIWLRLMSFVVSFGCLFTDC